jgi:hypothetical protein
MPKAQVKRHDDISMISLYYTRFIDVGCNVPLFAKVRIVSPLVNVNIAGLICKQSSGRINILQP